MPVLGIIASQISGHLFAPSGAYDSIATGTGGNITFSSIPQTYTHLQIRWLGRDATTTGNYIYMTINGIGGSSYAYHRISGDGASASVGALASTGSGVLTQFLPDSASTASVFGAGVIDILDYTNTNKYKTIRGLGGADINGSGAVGLWSTLFMNTGAITSITVGLASGSGATGTTFALYGIKGN